MDPRRQAEIDEALRTGEREVAIALLETHLQVEPGDADARHWLGKILLDLGRCRDAGTEWRRVRRADMVSDRALGVASVQTRDRVEAAAARACARLPQPFAKLTKDVPVLLEERPTSELVANGFDPRAYGLFEGPTHQDRGMVDVPPTPTRIVLYYANLAADFPDDEALEAQVAITVEHEVGHYFGLNEDDMERLGLD
ncbi:MAG: metallopeptidase family protein [Myxococcota bacterium]